MLAGLAPLHRERLAARGGPAGRAVDRLTFYDTSSYGPRAIDAMLRVVGVDQLVHGSDRPVIDPPDSSALGDAVERSLRERNPARLLGRAAVAGMTLDHPAGRDLERSELRALVDRPRPPARAAGGGSSPTTASQRVYEELLRDEHLSLWLICWMDDQDTGFHDHDTSAGAVAVVEGRVREERLAVGGRSRRPRARSRRVVRLRGPRHPPRPPHGRRPGRHAARLLAAAVAHGRLPGRARRHAPAPLGLLRRGAAAARGGVAGPAPTGAARPAGASRCRSARSARARRGAG